MERDFNKINNSLVELLSWSNGYFGRIDTWGQRSEKYEYIGYKLTKDLIPTLEKMSEEQLGSLTKIMLYFEIHALPLKKILIPDSKNTYLQIYYDIAWSHFMTIVMFGMLEVAAKTSDCKINDQRGYFMKEKSIICFLEKYLDDDSKRLIIERFTTEEPKTFSEIIDHFWRNVRSGFVHEANLDFVGLEWVTFTGGIGSKEDPIRMGRDVPIQDLFQIAWQSILCSYGYNGKVKIPSYSEIDDSSIIKIVE
jgi:hypothetical protein